MIKRHTVPNTALFKQIYEQIKEHPDSFDVTGWERSGVRGAEFDNPVNGVIELRSCDTTRCVAGWAGHFTDPTVPFYQLADRLAEEWGISLSNRSPEEAVAADLLGLSYREAYHLFYYVDDSKAYEVVRLFSEGKNAEAFEALWNR